MNSRKINFSLRYFLIIGLSFLSLSGNSQIDLSARHNLSFEIYNDFSLNYENSILVREKFSVLGYVGVASSLFMFNKYDYKTFGIPVGINMVFGKSKNHLESSLGFFWNKTLQQGRDRPLQKNYYQLKLGYRYQKLKDHNFIFKAGLTLSMEGKNEVPRDIIYSGILEKLFLGPYIGFGYGF